MDKADGQKLKPPTPAYARHIEIDELYFYVGNKKHKRWLWLAICRNMKRVLGFCTGERSTKTLEKLMLRISPIEYERYYTDRHAPFTKILPKEKHRNHTNQTNTIEGINSAVRHYLPRFRRRSKCYSKSMAMVEASIVLLSYRFSQRQESLYLSRCPTGPYIQLLLKPPYPQSTYRRFPKSSEADSEAFVVPDR